MRSRSFFQVDVFTALAFKGNPLAVVLDGTDLSTTQMQAFAAWTNLSETTFVLPPKNPTADYHLRIFTPAAELPFAGHPTLGTCHAWLQSGNKPKDPSRVLQECAAGLIQIRLGARPAFEAPPLIQSKPDPVVLLQIQHALGISSDLIKATRVLDNGPIWWGLLLDSAATVLTIQPDHNALAKLPKIGVIAPHPLGTAHADFEVRAFAASVGVPEDPVTGSLNASLAQWLISLGHAPANYCAAQGSAIGRAGRVWVESESNPVGLLTVWVGGDSVTCITGQVSL